MLLSFIFGGFAFAGWQLLVHPQTPVPDAWNPTKPLVVTDPVTALTDWKLARAVASPETCLAALSTGATAQPVADLVADNPRCGISPNVALRGVDGVDVAPLNTRCQTALRLAMWSRHGIAPAARDLLGSDIARIHHFSSYSCREIRTTSGSGGRMSTHATADAIDISGVTLSDGRRIDLRADWNDPARGAFLRAIRDTACTWFGTVLGPDYNRLHADHFHLQNRGWGRCS
ncbi:extensin family protein [Sulfitobacter sp. S190]|uniref:extensin-like domain-containing protein n=1 Tax=Sulfitobacter sp. S190 TaxID=2867022 RepID=UPI0021A612D1|nr:extensin family protein [Sulfitobacter sp. S190]